MNLHVRELSYLQNIPRIYPQFFIHQASRRLSVRENFQHMNWPCGMNLQSMCYEFIAAFELHMQGLNICSLLSYSVQFKPNNLIIDDKSFTSVQNMYWDLLFQTRSVWTVTMSEAAILVWRHSLQCFVYFLNLTNWLDNFLFAMANYISLVHQSNTSMDAQLFATKTSLVW